MSRPFKPTPDAVATTYGWADPKTGELLVSKRGLPNPILDYKRNSPFKKSAETVAVTKKKSTSKAKKTAQPVTP